MVRYTVHHTMNSALTDQYDSLYTSQDGVYGEPLPAVKKLTEYLSSGTVLDVGGGEGTNALYLARAGFTVKVIDLSKVGLSKVQAVAQEESLPITTCVSDVVLDGIDGKYDAVVCTFVLHHIDTADAVQVIKQMQDRTNPGGINVIATFLNEGGLYERNKKSTSNRYYPSEADMVKLYAGWEMLFLKSRAITSHARDKAGNRMVNQRIVLIARKASAS